MPPPNQVCSEIGGPYLKPLQEGLASYFLGESSIVGIDCPLPLPQDTLPPLSLEDVTTQFLRAMRDFLHAPETTETYRVNPTDFTRKRSFMFPRLAISLLSDHAKAAQNRLTDLLARGVFGDATMSPTASAFFQARAKIQSELFVDWADLAVNFFYANYPENGFTTTWHGRHLFAADCSILNLPDNPDTRATFSIHHNQLPGDGTVQAQASFLYDLLNEFPVHAALGKKQAEKQFLFNDHVPYLNASVVSVYDMGYADSAVISCLSAIPGDFIIRVPPQHSFNVVETFANGPATDEVVTLSVSSHQKALVSARQWPEQVTVRLVKVVLPSGEVEVLMTSLLDKDTYPAADIAWVYFRRWGVETAFNRFKHQLEVECFSSGKVPNIKQDFHATVFLQVLETILNKVQDSATRAVSKCKQNKYEYHVKKAGSYPWLIANLSKLFLEKAQTLSKHLITYLGQLWRQTSPIRPNRHFERSHLTPTKKLNYNLYFKKRT